MCSALYLTIAEWTNPSIFLFKHRSGVKNPPRSTPLLFLAKEIKRKRHEVRGVSTRAEAIIPCQRYCFYSARENLRGTERFYSRGCVVGERLSCLPVWEMSLSAVCL